MRTNKSSFMSSAWCLMLLLLWAAFPIKSGLLSEDLGFSVNMTSITTPDQLLPHTRHNLTVDSFNSSYNASFAADFVPTLACGNKTTNCNEFCYICYDMGLPRADCYAMIFKVLCYDTFHGSMLEMNATDWCVWSQVKGLYNRFTICTEEMAECLLIPWPNPAVEETFVEIHSKYFLDCPSEELADPPPGVVFALVMTPICLIPFMVVLVVFKTKNGDGSS